MFAKYDVTTKTFGFYVEDHGDCVEINEEYHFNLILGQNSGKQIIPDENDYPVLKEETIQDIANQKLAEIQAEKCRVRDGGMIVDGILWDTDTSAISAYMQFMFKLQLNNAASVPNWKASTGVWTVMDGTVLTSLMAEWETLQTSAFNWQKEKEEEVELCLSENDIESLKEVVTVYS